MRIGLSGHRPSAPDCAAAQLNIATANIGPSKRRIIAFSYRFNVVVFIMTRRTGALQCDIFRMRMPVCALRRHDG